MPRQAIDFLKTIIYKIVCNDLNITETYVGHTTNFVKRKYDHKKVCNNENDRDYNFKVYQTIRGNGGWDNWSMIQICEYPCNSLQDARTEERRYYELLNASLNMINPCRNVKEWRGENKDIISEKAKIYREENKEIIFNMNKNYREANKEKIAEAKKEYYDNNKEKIAERQKRYTCCCGSTIYSVGKSKHEKSTLHQNYINSLQTLNICVSI